MEQQLFDAELHVMRLLWSEGDKSAKELVTILRDSIGWNKNTTYTVIKRLVQKGAIERIEPGFICRPLISEAEVQQTELDHLVNRMFHGSSKLFFAALLDRQKLSDETRAALLRLLEERKEESP